MRIGIDCRFGSSPSGLGTYTREIVRSLLKRGDPVEYVLFVHSEDEKWIKDLGGSYELLVAPYAHYSLSEQCKMPRLIKKSGIDLLFSPHFNVPFFCPVPFVVTIHDLILHRYPNQAPLTKRLAYKVLMKRVLRKACMIIAVSHFTTKELRSVYGDSVFQKTTVVTEGVNPVFCKQSHEVCEDVLQMYDLKKPFFLYVGNAKEHKNIQFVIDAYTKLGDSSMELVLVATGKEVGRLHLADGVRVIPGVDISELSALYSSASAFVTASLYEGFCLPILEARACGCPVIASNKGAIPEVASDDDILVEPTVDALSQAMKSPPKRSEAADGFPSWEDAAEQTYAVIASAMKRL